MMPGTVAIPAPEHGCLAPFTDCLSALGMPDGSVVDWELGDDRRGSEWILFLDADSMFEPGLLMRLLAHERAMVCSLYLRRGKGFGPLAWSHRVGTTAFRIALRDLPGVGLIPICAAGCSGMLVRREVFERIESRARGRTTRLLPVGNLALEWWTACPDFRQTWISGIYVSCCKRLRRGSSFASLGRRERNQEVCVRFVSRPRRF